MCHICFQNLCRIEACERNHVWLRWGKDRLSWEGGMKNDMIKAVPLQNMKLSKRKKKFWKIKHLRKTWSLHGWNEENYLKGYVFSLSKRWNLFQLCFFFWWKKEKGEKLCYEERYDPFYQEENDEILALTRSRAKPLQISDEQIEAIAHRGEPNVSIPNVNNWRQ